MLRTAVFTLAALDALFGVDLMRLAQLPGNSSDGAVARALGAADALERIDPHSAQTAACAGRALLINDMCNILILEVFERAENGVGSCLAQTAQRAGLYDA